MSKTIERLRVFSLLLFVILSSVAFAYNEYYTKVYDSINVDSSEISTVEYGTANYNAKKLLANNASGSVVKIKRNINTSKVGKQTLVVEVSKDDVSKIFEIPVEVKDTVFPSIELESDSITLYTGDGYDLKSNVKRVFDSIDGDLEYNNNGSNYFYKIETDYNSNMAGNYTANVIAVDKSGNKTEKTFSIHVIERELTNRVVGIARSFIGYPYAYGGNGPSGFDCSGFVQYIYKQIGINLSRSASTQINDGYAVSYSEARPGDILSWGYSDGTVTHSALYVGNGKMIHATNPSQGVVLSDVAGWLNGSDVIILGVRRVL